MLSGRAAGVSAETLPLRRPDESAFDSSGRQTCAASDRYCWHQQYLSSGKPERVLPGPWRGSVLPDRRGEGKRLGARGGAAAEVHRSSRRTGAVLLDCSPQLGVARETTRRYYVVRCGCGRHQTTMHKTPRLPDHFRNKVAWMITQYPTRRKD